MQGKEKKRLIVSQRETMATLWVTIMRFAHACLCKAQDQSHLSGDLAW